MSDICDDVLTSIHSGGHMRAISTALATATIATFLTGTPAQSADVQPPSRPRSVTIFNIDDTSMVGLAWRAPVRTGTDPIRRYVIRWTGGRAVATAQPNNKQISVFDLDPGRYVFRVKAVSRAGSSPWTRSPATYVR